MPSGQLHLAVNSWIFPLVLPGTRGLISLSKEVLMYIMVRVTT